MVLVNASHQNRKWQQYRDVARAALEPVKSKSPELSYADLYAFAGVVAVEESGGPKIEYCVGREDDTDGYKPGLKTPKDQPVVTFQDWQINILTNFGRRLVNAIVIVVVFSSPRVRKGSRTRASPVELNKLPMLIKWCLFRGILVLALGKEPPHGGCSKRLSHFIVSWNSIPWLAGGLVVYVVLVFREGFRVVFLSFLKRCRYRAFLTVHVPSQESRDIDQGLIDNPPS
jgi:hypothetical protein